MPVNIHPYNNKYRDTVTSLICSIQRNEFEVDITLEDQPDLKNIESFYQNGRGNFWIAFVNEELAGTIALLDIGNYQGALRKMFVSEKFRGKEYSVGLSLLKILFSWAAEKDYKEIFLGTTEKFIAAQRFYEKNGFEEIAKQKLPENFPVMNVDVKFYRYVVSSL